MLFVTFKAAGNRYALPARDVDEVAPLVRLTPLPGAPDYVPGLMNYRGASLPVADLTFLLSGRASRPHASTRILVARVAQGLLAGFMVERALKAVDIDPAELAPPGAPAAPWVLGVASFPAGLVEVLALPKIIPDELAASLMAASEAR